MAGDKSATLAGNWKISQGLKFDRWDFDTLASQWWCGGGAVNLSPEYLQDAATEAVQNLEMTQQQ